MKRVCSFVLGFILVFGTTGTAMATNGYQLIGVGQIQKSMGGAVTAAPVDPMTAISNPAGMARIGKRADFSLEAFMPTRTVDFSATGGGETEGFTEMYGIPSLGWVAPAFNRDDMYFGGGMYATSGLGVDYDQTVFLPGAALGPGAQDVTFSGFSAIQFWKMAPTVAWNMNEQLSLGFALNLDYQSVTVRQTFRNVPFWDAPPGPSTFTQRDVNFDLGRPTNQLGFGASIGALYDVVDWVTVGASYTSKQFFDDSTYLVGTNDVYNFNGATGLAGKYKMDLDYPQQFAIGVAVEPIEPLTISFDIKWINWSDTHDKVDFSGPTNSFDTNGDGVGDSRETELNFGWEDQWVYALGIQYQATNQLTVRTGYNYSEAPLDEADVFNNLVLPAVVEHHFSLGAHYMLGDHWGIGLTYMKAFKEEVKGKNDVPAGFQQATPFTEDSDAKISLEEDSVGMQLTYLF